MDTPDNSPAYLGRVSLANDRKRQMNLIDRHINFNPRDAYTVGSHSQRLNSGSQTERNAKNTGNEIIK